MALAFATGYAQALWLQLRGKIDRDETVKEILRLLKESACQIAKSIHN
jgi:hypothetical protein